MPGAGDSGGDLRDRATGGSVVNGARNGADGAAPDSARPSLAPGADERLRSVAEQLAKTGWAAEIVDHQWRLVWVSDELKALIGESDDEKLGYGHHLLATRDGSPWKGSLSPESERLWVIENAGRMAADTPDGLEALREMLPPHLVPALDGLEPVEPPLQWSSYFEFVQPELPPSRVNYVATRLRDPSGEPIGTSFIYGSSLPATVLNLVARGDEGMFARMTNLIRPGRRKAAVMFADLQSSGTLSRRLPTAGYFRLIRTLTTEIDRLVAEEGGIVGKHAGDGVTAFFLADDLGSTSAAAAAAISTARRIEEVAERIGRRVEELTGVAELRECLMNVGLHWGGTLFMGQVVTGGRLEVTALGDEVNECARIQQSARGGEILASKSLVERLSPEDAERLGVDPEWVLYRTVSDLPAADEKAIRDAGSIPVTSFSAVRRDAA